MCLEKVKCLANDFARPFVWIFAREMVDRAGVEHMSERIIRIHDVWLPYYRQDAKTPRF
jgi:hypothetical protein